MAPNDANRTRGNGWLYAFAGTVSALKTDGRKSDD
jgi:hypothetical protein